MTHIHRDHYTLAAALGTEHGAVVSLGLGEKSSVDLMHQAPAEIERDNIAALLTAGAPQLAQRWARGRLARDFVLTDFPYPDEWISDLQLLPAHGPIKQTAHAPVEHLLGFHEARLGACLSAVTSAGVTAHHVAGALGWTRRDRQLDEPDDFDASLATLETAAHLDLLVAQGHLVRTPDAGVDRYRFSENQVAGQQQRHADHTCQ